MLARLGWTIVARGLVWVLLHVGWNCGHLKAWLFDLQDGSLLALDVGCLRGDQLGLLTGTGVSPCQLGLLTCDGWAHSMLRISISRMKWWRKPQDFLWPGFEVSGSRFCYMLFISQVLKSSPFQGEEDYIPPLAVWGYMCNRVFAGGSNLKTVLWPPQFTYLLHKRYSHFPLRSLECHLLMASNLTPLSARLRLVCCGWGLFSVVPQIQLFCTWGPVH